MAKYFALIAIFCVVSFLFERGKVFWYAIGVWLLFALRLRAPINELQRHRAGEYKEDGIPLVEIPSIALLLSHLKKFQYRLDKGDYVSRMELFEKRLADETRRDGDCDDIGHYQATQLKKLSSVQDAVVVSVGYRGKPFFPKIPLLRWFRPSAGHMACAYLLANGQWKLMNYQEVTALVDLKDARRALLEWASRKRGEELKTAHWFYAETTDFKRVKI